MRRKRWGIPLFIDFHRRGPRSRDIVLRCETFDKALGFRCAGSRQSAAVTCSELPISVDRSRSPAALRVRGYQVRALWTPGGRAPQRRLIARAKTTFDCLLKPGRLSRVPAARRGTSRTALGARAKETEFTQPTAAPVPTLSSNPGVPDSGQDLNVALKARIDLEVIAELSAESCHFDGLTWAQTGDIYASRGADECLNVAGPIIDGDGESEWQDIDDGLCDRSRDRHELAFGRLAHSACGDRERPHFRPASVRFDVRHADEHEQTKAIIGKLAG